ncbi:hypothetical protein [Neptuniibacter sp.]|uniref:hypothetical protein n=1 Tax=Neptuniibacter sp. TaxID=1962643 RepID=UPI0026360065|nr:hypothetical protein [Neptuniibacter sp.]MCP4597800.1 hypothetical protein [Neptuniibacter sp.]
MPHGISPAVKDHLLNNDSVRIATLFKLDFGAVAAFTDYGKTLSINLTGQPETFIPSDVLISYDSVNESSKLQIGTFNLVLSAVDQTFLNLALNSNYLNVKVSIYKTVLSASDTPIGSPWSIFEGYIKGYELAESKNSSEITFEVASHWSDFEKVNCRRTNAASQKRYFPKDSSMDWAASSIKDMKWGRK